MIELKILTNVYKDKVIEDEIHEVLIKKDVIVKKLTAVDDITSVQEELTEKGKCYKSRCRVHIQGEGYMVVKHKYEDIKQLKESKRYGGTTRRIGF